jgi:hypothetical protein
MADQLTTNGAADAEGGTDHAVLERPHSRRTLLTGAATGLAAAAVGAVATGTAADAAGRPRRKKGARPARHNGVGAVAQPALVDGADGGGDALVVSGGATFSGGPVSFSNSGTMSIGAGKKSATYTGASLTSASLVLANLQNSLPKVYVQAVVPNVSHNSFEIFLSKAVPHGQTAKVAWFVVN